MAVTILEGWNCDVDIAVNGLEAVRSVAAKKYDVVLMDLRMPEMEVYGSHGENSTRIKI